MKTKAERAERSVGSSARDGDRGRESVAHRSSFQTAGVGWPAVRGPSAAQRCLQETVDGSPVQLAQADRLCRLFGPPERGVETGDLGHGRADPAQLQLEEEEELQMQRQAMEEEEPLQGKLEPAQRQDLEEEELVQGKSAEGAARQLEGEASRSENRTGMPGPLKAGLEALSGMDLSDVRVHRESAKPARVNALAYAQGDEIHLAPGQERHLPHEAWHVVQQRQGRVRSTMRVAGVEVNDDPGLESEADAMGALAMRSEGRRRR